uniref:Spermatogenesis-defective protein 39 homolog n=1 Tax=Gadus morhua TaxID=8049 RepID=A0A8C5ANN1_GADMO
MSRAKADEDDYWNSSKFTLAFTFDEEDDDYTRLKESKKAVNSISALADEDDDDDDVEKVSWSGEPVGSISWSVKETASKLRPAGDSRELGFPKISASPSLPKNNSVYSLSSLFKGTAQYSTLDTPARHYAPELRKPKCEYKDYISNWSPQETILKMQQGKVVSLERFQSLQDKMLLLDKAVDGHDGNIITAILIYLKRSLCKEVLFRELVGRETALRHYIHYLKESGEQKVLLDLFSLSLSGSVHSLPFSPEDSLHVQDHYTLLERQIIIEENDKQVERTGQSDVFKRFPRKASILNMPLITTLYYSCFYHYSEPEGTYSSPANIRRTFKLAEKQYFLTALAARAKLKAWTDVDSLFTTRNWLGFTKKKSPVAFQRVLDILHKNNAPVQVLEVYVNLLEDLELKINMAHKFKCHDVIINVRRASYTLCSIILNSASVWL